MQVAITGGTGFIGSVLVKRHVERGDQVRVLTRRQAEGCKNTAALSFIEGDLVSNQGLEPFVRGVDVLYHCAGQLTNEHLMRELHVKGTQNLVDAAQHSIKHWVQLSSVGVYGPVVEGEITEDSPNNPVGEYELTKLESDEIVLAAANLGKFSCTVLRPSNVFGAEMTNQSLFGMINMIDRGLFFFIGKPGASANYIHVDNVVAGLIACGGMPASKGKIYNLSDYSTLEDFVHIISEELECKFPVLRMPVWSMRWISKVMSVAPSFPLTQARVEALTNRSVYPITRIQEDLGYQHVVSVKSALKQMCSAYKRNQ